MPARSPRLVTFNVYDLHGAGFFNYFTSAVAPGSGAYHGGIEVYFLEWSYGALDGAPGVCPVLPGESSLGTGPTNSISLQ